MLSLLVAMLSAPQAYKAIFRDGEVYIERDTGTPGPGR